jgi:hypothetical protein
MAISKLTRRQLEIYLDDHLAGSRGALRLMDQIEARASDPGFIAFVHDLRGQVDADRQQLVEAMTRLGVVESRSKQLVSTVAGTVGRRAKLARPGLPGPLARLLELEALSGGIWMKSRVWRTLEAAAFTELDGFDFEELIAGAERQLEAVEEQRRVAIRQVAGGAS